MKSEFYEIRSNLEKENKELRRELEEKVEEGKNVIVTWKTDVANLRAYQEKEMMEINRKNREIVAEYERNKEDILKEKKYLQDLIEVKEDEIREVKKEKMAVSAKKWVLGNGGKIDIVVKPMETLEIVSSRTRPRSKSRMVDKTKKEEEKKGGPNKK